MSRPVIALSPCAPAIAGNALRTARDRARARLLARGDRRPALCSLFPTARAPVLFLQAPLAPWPKNTAGRTASGTSFVVPIATGGRHLSARPIRRRDQAPPCARAHCSKGPRLFCTPPRLSRSPSSPHTHTPGKNERQHRSVPVPEFFGTDRWRDRIGGQNSRSSPRTNS